MGCGAGSYPRVLATTPLPIPGPHSTVGGKFFPDRCTVVEKSIAYGRSALNTNSFFAANPLASAYSNVSVDRPVVTSIRSALALNSAVSSVASVAGSPTDNVNGRDVPAGTVFGMSSRGCWEASWYFFRRQLFRTPPRVVNTALTDGLSTVMSRSVVSATTGAALGEGGDASAGCSVGFGVVAAGGVDVVFGGAPFDVLAAPAPVPVTGFGGGNIA